MDSAAACVGTPSILLHPLSKSVWRRTAPARCGPRPRLRIKILGISEPAKPYPRTGNKYVTVIIDLTAVRDSAGTARLLDTILSRPKTVFKTRLVERKSHWKKNGEVMVIHAFTDFKTATAEGLPTPHKLWTRYV